MMPLLVQAEPPSMIDNPDQVDRLLAKLRESLPLAAAVTPRLAAVVREQSPGGDVPRRGPVTQADYAGDEGGIMCRLEFGGESSLGVFFVSITQLAFDRSMPLAREIAAYQKHRIKRLRRLVGAAHPLQVLHG
jgi:hypothetical protein